MTLNPSKSWRLHAAGAALLAALTAAAYLVQVQPMLRQRHDRAAQNATLTANQQQLQEHRGTLGTLTQRLDQSQRQLQKHTLVLEPAARLNHRLAALTEIAAVAGLRIDGIEPGKTDKNARFKTVDIRMSGRGNYANCTRFLAQVHEKMPDTAVTSVDLAGQAGPVDNLSAFTLGLLWYTSPTD